MSVIGVGVGIGIGVGFSVFSDPDIDPEDFYVGKDTPSTVILFKPPSLKD